MRGFPGAARDDEERRGGVRSIQDALTGFLKSRGLTTSVRDTRIFQAWNDVVGENMARHARPVSFDVRGGRHQLVIEVKSSAYLQELKGFTGEDYRKRTNKKLGKELIASLVFRLER